MILDLFVLKSGVKVFLMGSIGSAFPLLAQVNKATDLGGGALTPHWVTVVAAVMGPLTSVALAYLTMRRMIKKDRLEGAEKQRLLDQEAEANLHTTMVDFTSVGAEERKDARAVLLEIIEFQRKERDHLQEFFTTQIKEKQSTIELQRAFMADVETFKAALSALTSLMGKLEVLTVGLTRVKTPLEDHMDHTEKTEQS